MGLTDALHSLAQGSYAYQRAMDQHAQMQQELQDQQTRATMNDIINRMTLEGQSRPITAGTVQDQMNAPDTTIGANPGTPAPDTSSIPPMLQRPPDQQDVTTADVQNLPMQGTTVPGQQYNYMRKPDASRTVTYKDRTGNQYQYELYTPQEQAVRARQRASADETSAALSKAAADATTRQSYGIQPQPGMNTKIGAPEDTRWLPAEWDKIAEKIITATKQPDLHFAASTDDDGNVTINGMDPRTGQLRSTSRFPGSGKQAASSSHLTTDDNGNVTAVTLDRKGKEKARVDLGQIGKSRTPPGITPGQQGVQDRFDQRERDAKQKELDALQAGENKEHAQRTEDGQQLSAMAPDDPKRAQLTARLKGSRTAIQGFQARKAKLLGAAVPPQTIQDKMPEGHQATAPDGHVWLKKDGIVYLVK